MICKQQLKKKWVSNEHKKNNEKREGIIFNFHKTQRKNKL